MKEHILDRIVSAIASLRALFEVFASGYASRVDGVKNAFISWTNSTLGTSGEGMTKKIVGVGVGLIVTAVVVPPALDILDTATIPSGMDAVETLLKTLLPILGVIAIVMYIYDQGSE